LLNLASVADSHRDLTCSTRALKADNDTPTATSRTLATIRAYMIACQPNPETQPLGRGDTRPKVQARTQI
jgi:hypothetical protein